MLVDARTKTCYDTDSCLDYWRPRNYYGDRVWGKVLRIALREYNDAPLSIAQTRELKPQVDALLAERGISTLVLMQTTAFPGEIVRHSAWNMYGRPGSPFKWAGCVWQEDGFFKCPILNPNSYEHVYEWIIRRWFQQAYAVASSRLRPLPWPKLTVDVDEEMSATLEAIASNRDDPVSVDIETNIGGTIITAIGFSNSAGTVSIPWDGFAISGTDEMEPALSSYGLGKQLEHTARAILASSQPKVFHNGAFDIFQLGKRGIRVENFAFDTLLMHRVAYPQYKHGLQFAAATEFTVEPWKCFWRPPTKVRASKGDDIWLSDPRAMHLYNCQDSFMTYKLYESLRWKVGL